MFISLVYPSFPLVSLDLGWAAWIKSRSLKPNSLWATILYPHSPFYTKTNSIHISLLGILIKLFHCIFFRSSSRFFLALFVLFCWFSEGLALFTLLCSCSPYFENFLIAWCSHLQVERFKHWWVDGWSKRQIELRKQKDIEVLAND